MKNIIKIFILLILFLFGNYIYVYGETKTISIPLEKKLNLISVRAKVKITDLKGCDIGVYKNGEYNGKKAVYGVVGREFIIDPSNVETSILEPIMGIFIYVNERCNLSYEYEINGTGEVGENCGIDKYKNGGNCKGVGIGYYSPEDNNYRSSCTNKDINGIYTSSGNGGNNCRWSCKINYHKVGNTCVANKPTNTNCIANTNYKYNGHTYNLTQLNHNATKTFISEQANIPTNGKTIYSLGIECNNGNIIINQSETSNITCNANYHKVGNTCVANKPTNTNCTANTNYKYNGHTYNLPQLNHNATQILTSEQSNTPTNGKTTYLLGIKCINGSIAINQPETISLITCNANYHKVGNTCVVDTTTCSGGQVDYNGTCLTPTSADCFTFSNGKITNYKNSCTKDVVIPKKINGVDVTSIQYSAFSHDQLTSVTIPNSVTSIGSWAFHHNKLTSVTIPNSVTSIGGGAFSNNQLPDNQAFIYARKSDGTEDKTKFVSYGGPKRDNVVIPNNVTSIGEDAFYHNNLTSVTIPNSVTSIGHGAFRENNLTSITISNNITSIGYCAFCDNQLTSITIPNSVTSIGEYAFNNNKLPDNQAFIYARKSDGTEDKTKLLSYGGTKRNNVIIPTSVTSIGTWAFIGNNLTSVTIPNSVTSIGQYAFFNNNLTSIIIPNSVTSIRNNAFGSNNLTNVIIGNSVTSIGNNAFGSNNLTNVIIPNSVTSIGNNIFQNNGSNKNSNNITDWTSGNGGTWNLNGRNWVKQTTTSSGWQSVDSNCGKSDITIGSQTWAGCNSTIGNGTLYTNSNVTDKNSEGNLYGKHYTWANRNSACPDGWHVPSRAEWTTLLTNLTCNNPTFGGGRQCDGLGWQNHTTRTASNNLVQALHIPLAGRMYGSSSYFRDTDAFLWSSESNGSSGAYLVSLISGHPSVSLYRDSQAFSFSVRCLKD